MFYTADQSHGLPYDPFKAIIAPRPIGWISSLDKSGLVNLAPYSFFNAIAEKPHLVMFASAGMKDSANNALETKEFTFNFVSRAMKDQMNITSGAFACEENEFDKAGLAMVAGEAVSCPRVDGVAAALECKVLDVINPTLLDGSKSSYSMVLGQVVGVYIDDEMITPEGRFDIMKADPILRAGYHDYACLDEIFELKRPE